MSSRKRGVEGDASMAEARVRGIYSTALTKLLLDHGFEIAQPSVATQERFGLKGNEKSPDLDVYDRPDRQGVRALGKPLALNAFLSILRGLLVDVIVRRWKVASNGIAPLREKNRFADVEFPALSKRRLDGARGIVVPTLEGHHYYKACGRRVSSALGMAERLLEKDRPRDEVKDLFEQTIKTEYPTAGSIIKIEHVKLDGRAFHLGMSLIEDLDLGGQLIRFRRVLRGRGTYDGLGTRREPGDYAITEARVGEWFLKTRYFAKTGQYKGTYVNLNTPIELYPHRIRYVDLEVDICLWPDGKLKALDEEKLERAAEKGLVTERLTKIVREKMEGLMKGLSRQGGDAEGRRGARWAISKLT